MRKRWFGGHLQQARIQLAYGAALALSLTAHDLHARAEYTHKVWEKAARFDYPALPADLGKSAPGSTPLRADSSVSKHWGLTHIGFFDIFTPFGQPALANLKACSKDIVVAVIDTGIDYTHPELKDNLWVNRAESGPWTPPAGMTTACRDKACNGIDDDNNGFVDDVAGWDFVHNIPVPYDTHGHGTHIAGIIAAVAGNGTGIVGVCPNVSIMPLKYYDNSVLGYNNLQNTVRAIQYAVMNGAHIINYSGGGADPAPLEAMAVKQAEEKGVLFVAAAGNDGHNNDWIPYYPASYNLDNIVSVASLNQSGQLLSSSNYGIKSVDVAAPGLGILSTLPAGRFGTMSGTSQATAFVSGTAALLASQLPDRGTRFDFKPLKSWLVRSTKPLVDKQKRPLVASGKLSVPDALRLQLAELNQPSVSPSAPAVARKAAKQEAVATKPRETSRPR